MSTHLIKQLRAASGAPMSDCKKAVAATASLDEAFEWLRKKGLSRAAKMANRVAEEGLVAFRVNAGRTLGCLVEVRSETDFVARNRLFQARQSRCARNQIRAGIQRKRCERYASSRIGHEARDSDFADDGVA